MDKIETYSQKAFSILREIYGLNAKFRDGQLDAILSVLQKERALVVQKTGWGKSLVYFISTKILREEGAGPTILISPLLSLMRNQIQSAEKVGLNTFTINSSNKETWEKVYDSLKNDTCDILMIAPEKLGNSEIISNILSYTRKGIGLFVIDEAHCISEWGHDFRPDYMRIKTFIQALSKEVPIIATTATANDRVVNDIKFQLGNNTKVYRGPLTRESLIIQIIEMLSQEERLAWLAENIKKIDGSGIVYCLTTRDCDLVANWLNINNISAVAYYADDKKIDRIQIENDFYNNKFKVIVATVALGMGYDKPDIKFVIHYQRPGSMLSYYQQIGRAGRDLKEAYAIILEGKEDDEIQNFFINTAFPTQNTIKEVLDLIENKSGISKTDILNNINIKKNRIDQCLKFLEIENLIIKEKNMYFRTVNPYQFNFEESNRIINTRLKELDEIKKYTKTKDCYMEFISKCLNDPYAKKCNKCANCKSHIFPYTIQNIKLIESARRFIENQEVIIEPRKKYPDSKNIPKELLNEIGWALCVYGDYGWGQLVKKGKYDDNYFSNKLVDASCNLLLNKKYELNPEVVVYVPSLDRNELVRSLACRIAEKLNIPCFDLISKTKKNLPQKNMENSKQQYENIKDCFELYSEYNVRGKSILLVDDMVDSKWTLTICGILLKQAGAKYVYPYVLASTAGKEY